MIVSHRHRFIFLKTKKTAGSSIEYALAEICGDHDIITPASRDEEPVRAGRGAQNYRLAWHRRSPVASARALFAKSPDRYLGFYNHMPARRVRALLGEEVWRGYYKFAFERNPWDRQVSLYFWRYPDAAARPSFRDFILNPRWRRTVPNFDIYGIQGTIAVDFVGRYESLEDDLCGVFERLGIESEPNLPRLKSGTRKGARDYRGFYDDETRALVGTWYAREIEAFGYEF